MAEWPFGSWVMEDRDPVAADAAAQAAAERIRRAVLSRKERWSNRIFGAIGHPPTESRPITQRDKQ